MEIHVARDGAALGVFSPDEVRAGLADGRFRRADLAWRAGMASWTPLAEWPEFAATPAFALSAAEAPSGTEWETRPSFGALLRGIASTLLGPGSLAGARLGFGSSFGGAYLALLLALVPFVGLVLVNQEIEPRQMEVIAEVAGSINPDFAAGFLEGYQSQQDDAESPGPAMLACGSVCALSLLPLFLAALGLLQWPLYRLVGAKVAVGRVVAGGLLVGVWMGVALLPVSLLIAGLGFLSPGGSLLAGLLLQLAGIVLYSRAMGHALGCGIWRALGVQLLLFTFCCACLCCVMMLVGFATAAASA